jgi:hypothetical protein
LSAGQFVVKNSGDKIVGMMIFLSKDLSYGALRAVCISCNFVMPVTHFINDFLTEPRTLPICTNTRQKHT